MGVLESDAIQEIAAVVVISKLIAATGGADSPYFGFIFYPVLYSGFFLRGRVVTLVTLEACIGAERRSQRDALTGPLTGVSSRRGFESAVERLVSKIEPGAVRCALLLMDVDNFKGVKTRYGHLGGDQFLRSFASEFAGVAGATPIAIAS